MTKPTKCSIIQDYEWNTFVVLWKEDEGKSYMCIPVNKEAIDWIWLVEVMEDDIQWRCNLIK